MRKKIINSKSNCSTTLQKFFSPEKEQVYKLNLKINFQNKHLNNSLKNSRRSSFNLFTERKYFESIEMNELLNSVEKVKKFLPDITKIVNYKNNYKIEDKLFKRFEHHELENLYKERIKKKLKKKEEIKNELYILRNNLKNIEDEISDTYLDLNIYKDANKYLHIRSEDNFRRRSRSRRIYRTLKINDKKLFDPSNYNIKNELNDSINSNDNNSPRNKNNINNNSNNNNIFNFNKDNLNNNNLNNNNNIIYKSEENKNEHFSNISYVKLISYINSNRNTQIIKLSNKITLLKNQKNKISEEIQKLEEEKKKINIDNEELKDSLYKHYLGLLREGDDTRSEGLSWIIKEIFSLNKNVLISYLPKFLDENGIAFLFKQAKIYEKIDGYDKKLINIKKDLINLGIINNLEKTESIWKKVDGTEFLGYEFEKTFSNNLFKIKNRNKLKEKYLFRSLINRKLLSNNINSISNSESKNNNISIKENSFNTRIQKKLISPVKTFQKINLSRNISNGSNNMKNKKLFSSRKSYILNYNLQEVQKYRHNLTIEEIKKLLKDTKIKIDKNCVTKIREFLETKMEKKLIKQLLIEMKKNEMQRIFEEYSKRSYYQRFMADKNVVLSALVGEDNIIELNKIMRDSKNYYSSLEKWGRNHGLVIKQNLEGSKDLPNFFG